jgi:lysophospholipase L1-like esterase
MSDTLELAKRRAFAVRRRLGNLVLACFSVLVALLIAESALDAWGRPGPQAGWTTPAPFYPWSLNTSAGEPISEWGYLQLALHPLTVYSNLPDQRAPYYSTDERGFRRNGAERRPDPVARVIVVGGSAAFGTGLPSDADTFPARLEALLEGTEVLNAAVIGHLSGQELSYVAAELVDLRPDLIIALDGWNDLVDQTSGRRRTVHTAGVSNSFFMIEDRLRQLSSLETGAWPRRAANALPLVFKNLARLLGSARGEIAASTETGDERGSGPWIGRDAASIAAVYARNIEKLRTLADAFGSRFLCVLQADREAFRVPKRRKGGPPYVRFREEARGRLRAAGVAHVDLNDYANALRPAMFMDRVHLDAEGNRAVAGIVRDVIRSERLLEARGVASDDRAYAGRAAAPARRSSQRW